MNTETSFYRKARSSQTPQLSKFVKCGYNVRLFFQEDENVISMAEPFVGTASKDDVIKKVEKLLTLIKQVTGPSWT